MVKTTIQISEGLRKSLKILASYRDISYEDVLEDFVNLFSSVIPFKNEMEFAKWFEGNLESFGFKEVVEKRKTYPDYILIDKNGAIKKVELEIFGIDFLRHKHDPKKVDSIICVYSDRKDIEGTPVTAVIENKMPFSEFVQRAQRISITVDDAILKALNTYVEQTNAKSRSDALENLIRSHFVGRSTCVILAGGKPSKLIIKELNTYRPLVKIGDKTLIEDIITKVRNAGYYNVIIIGYHSVISQIQKVLGNGAGLATKITYIEETKERGTAKTLELAKNYLNTDFLFLPCDHWFDFDLKGLYQSHSGNNGLVTLAVYAQTSFNWKTSIVDMDGNKIINYEEFPRNPKTHLISMLIGFMKPDVFNLIPPGDVYCSLQEHIFPKLASMGELIGYPIAGKWVNVHNTADVKNVMKS